MVDTFFYLALAVLGCGMFAGIVLWRKYRDWERATLIALGFSLAAVLGISWWGAYPANKGQLEWVFLGIDAVFSVFEGDSDAFRAYAGAISEQALIVSWLLSCAVPLLTVFTALSLLWNYLPHHVPLGAKVWYIFSELDNNSLRMAKSLNCADGVCIFLRTHRGKQEPDVLTELQELKHFLYPRDEVRFLLWPWRRKRTLRFFFLSENTDENFNRMNAFLEEVRDKHLFSPVGETQNDHFQQELYLLSETESAPMLIDHLRDKLRSADGDRLPVFQNTELCLLDRFRATSYDLLLRQPLHAHIHDGKLHVLVLGFGRIGREFFRAAASMGVIHNCTTEFTLCDLEIERKLNAFLCQCPELERSVRFHSRKLDADTDQLDELIRGRHFHYILVSLGDDERNIRVASRLKVHHRRLHWAHEARKKAGRKNAADIQPQICVNIENSIKHSYTESLWTKTFEGDRALYVFGGLDQVFTKEVLMPQNLWKAARYLHRLLNRAADSGPLNWNEYERRSSIACAAHAAYHVAAVGEDYDSALKLWKPGEYEALVSTEHRRWMAYVRSEGLRKAGTDLLDVYYSRQSGRHVEILGKLTPCLVDTETELEDIWQYLREHHSDDYQNQYSFRERDALLIRHANTIAELAKPDASPNRTTAT